MKLNNKSVLLAFCLFFAWLVGCTSTYDENGSYKESKVNQQVPIPANAKPSEAHFSNPNINKGKKYNLDNIGGEQGLYRPKEYFDELKNWGWEELKNQQIGSIYFFMKDETIISIDIKEDYFQLFEMKEDFEF